MFDRSTVTARNLPNSILRAIEIFDSGTDESIAVLIDEWGFESVAAHAVCAVGFERVKRIVEIGRKENRQFGIGMPLPTLARRKYRPDTSISATAALIAVFEAELPTVALLLANGDKLSLSGLLTRNGRRDLTPRTVINSAAVTELRIQTGIKTNMDLGAVALQMVSNGGNGWPLLLDAIAHNTTNLDAATLSQHYQRLRAIAEPYLRTGMWEDTQTARVTNWLQKCAVAYVRSQQPGRPHGRSLSVK